MVTFMLRRRVIIPTASADRGTGDPMPMSFPVSRGSGCGRDDEEGARTGVRVAFIESAVSVPTMCGGRTGGARSSDGVVSRPPLPRFGPYIQNQIRFSVDNRGWTEHAHIFVSE
jgi:hypothetical protein